MPRIQPLNPEQTDINTRSTLQAIRTKLGLLPNLYATVAHAPAALTALLSFSDAISAGSLSAAQRETIALAVGQTNQCQYCLSAHTLVAKGAGLSAEQIRQARQTDNPLSRLAAKLVEQRGVLSDEDLQQARNAGFDDAQLIEIVAVVVMNIFTNYINHLAETEIDFPVVDLSV